jgi:cupin fold WbuC family metalloprotein
MKKIYSKVEPSKLLHIVVRKKDLKPGRVEVVSENNFIQCALLNMEKGKTFQPHKHIWKSGEEQCIAQESWVVIKGKVQCTFFDVNDEVLVEPILQEGDASFTLEGGHTYTILENDTLVYEYKTGPYKGQKQDKIFI